MYPGKSVIFLQFPNLWNISYKSLYIKDPKVSELRYTALHNHIYRTADQNY